MEIGCDSCDLWYHGTCINVIPASNLSVILVCRLDVYTVEFFCNSCVFDVEL